MLRLTRNIFLRPLLQASGKRLQQFSTLPPVQPGGYLNFNYLSELDTANINALLHQTQLPTQTFLTKLQAFTFSNTYATLDEMSREILFYLSTDLGLGLATAILLVSFGLKAVFMKYSLRAFMGSIKMKEIESEMVAYQEKLKLAQQTRNMQLMKQAQLQLKEIRRRNNVNTSDALINMLQFPFLMTWFFSLRYILTMPELYPGVKTEGLLWFTDLSAYDSFFVLPLLSALFSYYNLSNSPNIQGGVATVPLMAQLQQYMRYFPFVAMLMMIWFPSGLNLYWSSIALTQTLLTLAVNNPTLRAWYGIGRKRNIHEKILKAIVGEKPRIAKSAQERLAGKLTEGKDPAKTADASTAEPPKPESPVSSGMGVQVMSNRPRKPKK